jgi:hypothetical protein
MISRFTVFLFFVFFSFSANAAYPCPNGPGPGERQVGTTGGSHGIAAVPVCESSGSSGAVGSGAQWASRWGAIYTDSQNGFFGVSESMLSKRKAMKAAENDCRVRGGSKCKLRVVTDNQCRALAVRDGYSSANGAATKELVERNAIAECSTETRRCTVLYSGCSYPVRVR